MNTTLKVTVRYDGTNFSGWQFQPGLRTVQGEIEGALSRIARQHVAIMGSGRTDKGVHALGQVFSCTWPGERDTAVIKRAVSSMLSPEIRIEQIEHAHEGFDACRDAIAKRYAYTFCLAKASDPFTAKFAWNVPWELDWARAHELAQRLLGEHDFAGFRCAGSDIATSVRTIYSIELKEGGAITPFDTREHIHLLFRGNGFLYKMVRNIAGSLVNIVRGKLPEERFEEMLHDPGPFRGFTAPARGLALVDVEYKA